MINKDEITMKILGKTYGDYEKEKTFILKVSGELENLSGHGDCYTDNNNNSNKLNNAKAKAKLRRLLDDEKEMTINKLNLKEKN